jgi:hypothetical protein
LVLVAVAAIRDAVYGPTLASAHDHRPLCYSCHGAKTERDRKAGKVGPRPYAHVRLDDDEPPDEERGPPEGGPWRGERSCALGDTARSAQPATT